MTPPTPFWRYLAAACGPPVFAGTLVACLLSGHFDPLHGVLLALGFALIVLGYRRRPPG